MEYGNTSLMDISEDLFCESFSLVVVPKLNLPLSLIDIDQNLVMGGINYI